MRRTIICFVLTGLLAPISLYAAATETQELLTRFERDVLGIDSRLGVGQRPWLEEPRTVGPLEEHISDAIRINKARTPLYAELTDGASLPISRKLVFLESIMLPVARAVDWYSRRWRTHGVPVGAEDFVSMSLVADFVSVATDTPPPLSSFEPLDGAAIDDALALAYDEGGFPAARVVIERQLEKLEELPAYHCMLRHMLESALRVVHLAPYHAALAAEKGLPSTERFSWFVVRMHTYFLGNSTKMDTRAAPIQARGIPILRQDVPPVSLESPFYDE